MKHASVLLIVAVVFLIVGALLCGIAFALDGSQKSLFSFSKFEKKENTIATPFEHILVNEVEFDVIVMPSKDNQCRISWMESDTLRHKTEVTKDNGATLVISREDDRSWLQRFSFFTEPMTVTIFLPGNRYQSLCVKTASGDVRIQNGLLFENAIIGTASGEVKFDSGVEEKLEIHSVSGEIEVNGTVAKEIVLSTTSGEIDLETISANQVGINTISGSVEAEGLLVNGHLTMQSTSGGIVLERCDANTLSITTVSGHVRGTLLTPKTFRAKSVSGNIRVPEDTIGGQGLCEIKTTSGDIAFDVKRR